MATYWIDFLELGLPGFLLMLPSVVPLLIATVFAVHSLRKKRAGTLVRNIWGSTAAGVVALGLLFGSLFGNDSSSSSTAGLVFLFVPIYSAMALGIGYGLGAAVYRKVGTARQSTGMQPQISRAYARFILVPVAILCVLLFGMLKYSIQHNDLTVAEKAADLDTLHYVYAKSLRGEADSFGVPLFLAQNPSTPADILTVLAMHQHSSVRMFVARHRNTPLEVVAGLADDCDEYIRKAVEDRLKEVPGFSRSGHETPQCGVANRTR